MIVLFFCAFYGSHNVLLILGTHDMPFLIKRCVVETCLVQMQTDDRTMMALIGSPSDGIKELVYSGSDLVLRVHKTERLIHRPIQLLGSLGDLSDSMIRSQRFSNEQLNGEEDCQWKMTSFLTSLSSKASIWHQNLSTLSCDIIIYQSYYANDQTRNILHNFYDFHLKTESIHASSSSWMRVVGVGWGTSRSDLPGALCTRMFPTPSLGMVSLSRLHSMVAGGLDMTSQLMLTGFPSHEKNIVWLVWNLGASVKER